jgi:O-antigen/teichoic acid export membrane protein
LKNKINYIKNKLGIDGAIAFTSLSRIIQAIGGIVSVILVATLLDGIEQGFYYTFASILAIQVFFELGLNGIITQYVAHETAHLTEIDNRYEGNEINLSRIASILHFTIKWFSLLAIFVFIMLLVIGFVFFTYYYNDEVLVDWQIPWVLLSLGTTLNFMISPILAFLEGVGKVKDIAKIRVFQQVINLIVLWSGLIFGFKLYVGGLSSIIGLLVLLYFVIKQFFPILQNIYNQKITEKVSYKMEIFPLQWRIALSWVGGYFIFQLFNPVLFATEGPIVAGQMGMTLSILNAVLALSFAWVSTKIPIFSGYIAQKDYLKLDRLFNMTFTQSSFINIIALVGVFFSIFLIRYFNIELAGKSLSNKFLPYFPLLLMMISFYMNHIIGSWAVYLRCHKKEPMLMNSLAYGILSCFSTLILGNKYGVNGITFGYCVISIIIGIWAYFIYVRKKNKWHFDGV